MSLMGYTESDILQMKICVEVMLEEAHVKFLKEGLTMTKELLEGLLAEGRV